MIFDHNILCFTCKGCGDINVNTVLSADPKSGTTTKTTTLGGIWCDKRDDKVEPRFCCPCYEDDSNLAREEDIPEYSADLIFFLADEDTRRQIHEAAQHNKMTEGQLVSCAVDYYLKEVMQP